MSQQAAAQPKSILRGHRTQVHATTFIRRSQRLASGDADGFVVLWDLTIMRPRAVWRAHTGAILGVSGWGDDKVITEGRDNRLIVWKITLADEEKLSTDLPLDESAPERPQPWILHILEINTLNFCSFAQCSPRPDRDMYTSDELLVSVPNTLRTEAVDIFHLPSQNRQSTVHLGSKTEKKGMVMALSLFWRGESLLLLAGYENGLAVVAQRRHGGAWDILYKFQAHSQPILSLDFGPDKEYFLTSGADAIIAKHPIPHANPTTPLVPVFKAAETPEIARNSKGSEGLRQETTDANPSLLSAGLAATSTQNTEAPPRGLPKKAAGVESSPIKVVDTKHSGQQGLQIRSDGRIFATAGWDSKIRVYSAKTMAELAVLKWHDVGCYAAAFAVLGAGQKNPDDSKDSPGKGDDPPAEVGGGETTIATVTPPGELSVKERRIKTAKEAHWLAAGSKDGKISLWDIY
ncbi:WD repeat-containing protein [Xylaria grammica]|nr:WD repeat-containing protein [Xylaria grammica]